MCTLSFFSTTSLAPFDRILVNEFVFLGPLLKTPLHTLKAEDIKFSSSQEFITSCI